MAKKPTYAELEGKVQFFEHMTEEARKEIRKALRQHKIWNQDFHQNEFAAITAVFLATKDQLDNALAELQKKVN